MHEKRSFVEFCFCFFFNMGKIGDSGQKGGLLGSSVRPYNAEIIYVGETKKRFWV